MRFARIQHQGAEQFARIVESAGEPSEFELLTAAPWLGGQPTEHRVARSSVQLLAPVTPSKIVCVGRNYAAHAAELGNAVPSEPLLFLKPPSALTAPDTQIVLPAQSERVEYESEIGIVIGTRIHAANEQAARAAIFGITSVNDVTARDVQRRETQFTRAKGFDTFCPVGPWIAEIDASTDLASLTVTGRLNGEVRQHAQAQLMVTSIPQLIAFISHVMTLEPGDLIATGTPQGVGQLNSGDVFEVEVSGVGTLRNRVVAPAAAEQ